MILNLLKMFFSIHVGCVILWNIFNRNSQNDLVESCIDEDIGNSELLNINTVDEIDTLVHSRKGLDNDPGEENNAKKAKIRNPFVFKW